MKLDRDGSGSIDKDEFLQVPAIASNPLALRMIAIFDDDGGGTVDFQEFVAGLSAFSSQGSREEKLKFAFKVYDMDRDGLISNGELFLVLKMMVGNNLKDQQLQQIVDKTIMEADKDGSVPDMRKCESGQLLTFLRDDPAEMASCHSKNSQIKSLQQTSQDN